MASANLLPVLALNIGVPRHSYIYDFYPAIHFVDHYNVGATMMNDSVSVYVEVP